MQIDKVGLIVLSTMLLCVRFNASSPVMPIMPATAVSCCSFAKQRTRMCFAEQVLSTLQRAVMAGCCHTSVLAEHSDTCCVLESQLLNLNGKLLSNSCEPYP